MPSVIRALWGDDREGCRWHKVWVDIQRCLTRQEVCPFVVYVYGKDNAERLKQFGCDVVLVHDDPFPDGKEDRHEGKLHVVPWHYKHELILAALRDHGKVIYCDWDLKIVCKDPNDAFALLEDRSFSLMAMWYRRRRHFKQPRDHRSQHINVCGAWLYCGDETLPKSVIEAIDADPAAWHDEIVMNDLVDKWHGGWPGESVWLEKYESPVAVVGAKRSPWPFMQELNSSNSYQRIVKKTPVPFVWHKMFAHY